MVVGLAGVRAISFRAIVIFADSALRAGCIAFAGIGAVFAFAV